MYIYSVTCGFDNNNNLECTQQITFQYSDNICLEPCLSCKINLNNCDYRTCCNSVTTISCSLELSGCGTNDTGCYVILKVKEFVNNITDISIVYNGYTYNESKVILY